MSQYKMSQEAATTAAQSAGSAWKEQEKYSDSLQARINRLSNAWTELSLAAGDAVISDGIVALTEALKDLVQAGASVTKTIGLLPQVFGAATTALLLFNTTLRAGTIDSGKRLIELFRGFPARIQSFSASTATARTSIEALKISFATLGTTAKAAGAFLAGAALPIAAFMAIGFVIEKIVSAFSEAKQKQEEFEESQRKSVEAITTNKEQTDQLIKKYQELQKAKDKGTLSADQEQEYLQVTQQFSQTFPNLIQGYDSQGNAIIKNNDALKEAIENTKQLADLNKDEIRNNSKKTFEDSLNNIQKLKDEIKSYQQISKQMDKMSDPKNRNFFDTITNPFMSDLDYKNEANKYEKEAIRAQQDLSSVAAKIREDVLQTIDAFNKAKITTEVTK